MGIACCTRLRFRWLDWSAGALLLISCSKPPPAVAFLPPGSSGPLLAAVVATQATLMQARYGCTLSGCRHGLECDAESKLCRPLRERPAGSSATATAAQNSCVGSTDGLITLCALSVAEGSFQIRAENVGPKAIVLSLREFGVRSAALCAPSAPAPVIKPLGLRFLVTGSAAPNEPRDALFLSPGPTVNLEVLFEGAIASECALELEATFAVGDRLLQLTGTQSAPKPR